MHLSSEGLYQLNLGEDLTLDRSTAMCTKENTLPSYSNTIHKNNDCYLSKTIHQSYEQYPHDQCSVLLKSTLLHRTPKSEVINAKQLVGSYTALYCCNNLHNNNPITNLIYMLCLFHFTVMISKS